MIPLQEERPIPTLNSTELLLQWKVMKALGYKSLFDVNFRRELRNPYRRILYYRMVILEEYTDKKGMMTALTNMTDRLTFFQDPELYRKVKAEEDRMALEDPATSAQRRQQAQDKYDKDQKRYTPPSAEEKERMAAALSHTKLSRSFG